MLPRAVLAYGSGGSRPPGVRGQSGRLDGRSWLPPEFHVQVDPAGSTNDFEIDLVAGLLRRDHVDEPLDRRDRLTVGLHDDVATGGPTLPPHGDLVRGRPETPPRRPGGWPPRWGPPPARSRQG